MTKCVSCGKTILDDMSFCPYCGQPVVSDESERFEPAKGEVITAVAAPARIEGHEGIFALAFTKERLIFARIESHPGDQTKGELLQAGIFFPGSSGTSNVSRFYEMTPELVLKEAGTSNVSRFYEMTPELVLKESPVNFILDNADVDAVKLSYDAGSYVADLRHGEKRTKITLPYDKYYRDLLFRAFENRMSW